MKTKSTTAVFRVWRDNSAEPFALFPFEPGTNDPATCLSYERLGQHGAADPQGCVRRSRLATRKECTALVRELRGIGYRLRITSRIPGNAYAVRRSAVDLRAQ